MGFPEEMKVSFESLSIRNTCIEKIDMAHCCNTCLGNLSINSLLYS